MLVSGGARPRLPPTANQLPRLPRAAKAAKTTPDDRLHPEGWLADVADSGLQRHRNRCLRGAALLFASRHHPRGRVLARALEPRAAAELRRGAA